MQSRSANVESLQRDHIADAFALGCAIARRSRYLDEDDALTAAMDGLAVAARTYDPQRSDNFWKYAKMRIRWAILDFQRRHDAVWVSLDEWHEPFVWDSVERRVMARRILAHVSAEERVIMVITEVYGRRLADVATACGVTSGRISQRRRAVMDRMRTIAGVNPTASDQS